MALPVGYVYRPYPKMIYNEAWKPLGYKIVKSIEEHHALDPSVKIEKFTLPVVEVPKATVPVTRPKVKEPVLASMPTMAAMPEEKKQPGKKLMFTEG
jgi:hypothetical protein